MKSAVIFAVLIFSQSIFATPRSPAAEDYQFQVLYSELKFVEAETLRVEFTIEVLEERLFETPLPEDPQELFMQLTSLYKYYTDLGAYEIELNDQWNQLLGNDDGAPIGLAHDQLTPIPMISKSYLEGLPEGAIPVSDLPLIPLK